MRAMQRTLRFSSPAPAALTLGAVVAVGLLVGCGSRGQQASQPNLGGPVAVPIPEGPGCPGGAAVFAAVYHEAANGSPATWTLPLGNRAATSETPRYQRLDEPAVVAAGLTAPPPKLWLMVTGAPPCEATPGPWYSDTVHDGTPNDVLGVELTSRCAVPGKDQPMQVIAVAADVAPTGCVAILPRPIAGRVGEAVDGTWQIMAQSTPLPPALEAAIEQRPCAAPCERLWTASQLDFGGKPIAWDVSLEYLVADPAKANVCEWTTSQAGGLWAATAAGGAAPLTHQYAQVPLHLGALLADRSGPKVLVLEHIGEYATFDLGGVEGQAPQPARYLRWYIPTSQLYGADRKLGPYCGP